jgi:hypothetical protein
MKETKIFSYREFDKLSYFITSYNSLNMNEAIIIDEVDLSFLQLNDVIMQYISPIYSSLKNLCYEIYNNEAHDFKNNENIVLKKIETMLFLCAIMISLKKTIGIANLNETEYDGTVKSILTELRLNGVGYELVVKYIQFIIQTNILINKLNNTSIYQCSNNNECLPIVSLLINFIKKYNFNIKTYLSNLLTIINNIEDNDIDGFSKKIKGLDIKPNPTVLDNVALLTEGLEHMKISKEMKEKIKPYISSNSRIKNGAVFGLKKTKEYNNYLKQNDIPDECSLGADGDGFFVYTHRARSKSYKIPTNIPLKDIKFINSTG